MSILELVAKKLSARKADSMTEYYAVVSLIAAGKEPAVDRVEKALVGAGKTLDELQKSVQLYARRLTLAESYRRIPAIEKEKQEHESLIAKEEEKLQKAQEAAYAATAQSHYRLQQITGEIIQGQQAKMELFNSCPYPWLVDQHKILLDRYQQQDRELFELRRLASSLPHEIESDRKQVQRRSDGASWEEVAQHNEAKLKRTKARIEELEPLAQATKRELDLIEQKMYEP